MDIDLSSGQKQGNDLEQKEKKTYMGLMEIAKYNEDLRVLKTMFNWLEIIQYKWMR